jgi:hypothetical protein
MKRPSNVLSTIICIQALKLRDENASLHSIHTPKKFIGHFLRLFSRGAGAILVPATNSTLELRYRRKLHIAVSHCSSLAERAMEITERSILLLKLLLMM